MHQKSLKVELEPITRHGKNRIREEGNQFEVLEIRDKRMLLRSVLKPQNFRWVELDQDQNFKWKKLL